MNRLRNLVFAALLVTACSPGTAPLGPLSPDAVILAYGDSLTYGTGAGPEESYPAVLERLSGRKVINAGVPGELSGEGAENLEAALNQWQPDLLILMHGGNDLLRHRSPDEIADNLRRMIRQARDRGVDVVLIGVPEPGLWLSVPDFYARIADEFNLPYEAEVIGEIESDRSLKSDPIHPNPAGYRLLAERIHALLVRAGALD